MDAVTVGAVWVPFLVHSILGVEPNASALHEFSPPVVSRVYFYMPSPLTCLLVRSAHGKHTARTMLRLALVLCSCVLARGSNAVGEKFLADNKNKEGVITLPSGMQYKVLRQGDGTDHPTLDSPCECHYEGRSAANYPDGEKFDSSYDRGDPTTFAPNQVPRPVRLTCACRRPRSQLHRRVATRVSARVATLRRSSRAGRRRCR